MTIKNTPAISLDKKIKALIKIGDFLEKESSEITEAINKAFMNNGWFTTNYAREALRVHAKNLSESVLMNWIDPYRDRINKITEPKTVGLVMAGNIPLVGFNDLLCVLISGHKALVKPSSQDEILISFVIKKIIEIEPAFKPYLEITDQLNNFSAAIATGSSNSSRYFEYYFSHVPHIIRKNRNSIAIIKGDENKDKLKKLGLDLFTYYGLGCRNVSKIYFPENYLQAGKDVFFNALEPYKNIMECSKYANNYLYNKSILLISGKSHFDNGFMLLKPDNRISSPISVVHFEEYANLSKVQEEINIMKDSVQCLVGEFDFSIPVPTVKLGSTQNPALWDYADGTNTMDFLTRLR